MTVQDTTTLGQGWEELNRSDQVQCPTLGLVLEQTAWRCFAFARWDLPQVGYQQDVLLYPGLICSCHS